MARARNIKPSFFTNDLLAEIQPLGRLLFAGMWTIADREGRLEDRPKRIKAEVLPYDDCDADALLGDLNKYGFILRYESGGQRYIQILAFAKHQNPHIKEAASTIPAPDKHCANTVQGTTLTGTSHADSLLPITDSLLPINAFVAGKTDDQPPDEKPTPQTHPNCPHKEIIALYHELLPANPMIRDWTAARADALRARWNEDKQRQTLDYWRKFFLFIAESKFLTGRKTGKDGRAFTPGLEWFVKAENFAKIREGRFHEDAA